MWLRLGDLNFAADRRSIRIWRADLRRICIDTHIAVRRRPVSTRRPSWTVRLTWRSPPTTARPTGGPVSGGIALLTGSLWLYAATLVAISIMALRLEYSHRRVEYALECRYHNFNDPPQSVLGILLPLLLVQIRSALVMQLNSSLVQPAPSSQLFLYHQAPGATHVPYLTLAFIPVLIVGVMQADQQGEQCLGIVCAVPSHPKVHAHLFHLVAYAPQVFARHAVHAIQLFSTVSSMGDAFSPTIQRSSSVWLGSALSPALGVLQDWLWVPSGESPRRYTSSSGSEELAGGPRLRCSCPRAQTPACAACPNPSMCAT